MQNVILIQNKPVKIRNKFIDELVTRKHYIDMQLIEKAIQAQYKCVRDDMLIFETIYSVDSETKNLIVNRFLNSEIKYNIRGGTFNGIVLRYDVIEHSIINYLEYLLNNSLYKFSKDFCMNKVKNLIKNTYENLITELGL